MWGGGVWSAACETRWKTERGRYKTGVGGIGRWRERGELRGSTLQRYPNQRWRISWKERRREIRRRERKGRETRGGRDGESLSRRAISEPAAGEEVGELRGRSIVERKRKESS